MITLLDIQASFKGQKMTIPEMVSKMAEWQVLLMDERDAALAEADTLRKHIVKMNNEHNALLLVLDEWKKEARRLSEEGATSRWDLVP